MGSEMCIRDRFFNGSVPGGLVEGTIVQILAATTDTFQVEPEGGGGAINITSEGASTVRISIILPETFGAAGTLTISDADLSLNL